MTDKTDAGLLADKICSSCAVRKPVADFAMRNRSVRRGQCRECWNLRHRSPEKRSIRNAANARNRTSDAWRGRERKHSAKRYSKFPEQAKAKQMVRRAIQTGALVRPAACEICGLSPKPQRDGKSSIHGHHDDYSKPLVVRWLCHACHIKVHYKEPV